MSAELNESTPETRAEALEAQYREDMAIFMGFQSQSSGNAAKILSVLNGGLAVSADRSQSMGQISVQIDIAFSDLIQELQLSLQTSPD